MNHHDEKRCVIKGCPYCGITQKKILESMKDPTQQEKLAHNDPSIRQIFYDFSENVWKDKEGYIYTFKDLPKVEDPHEKLREEMKKGLETVWQASPHNKERLIEAFLEYWLDKLAEAIKQDRQHLLEEVRRIDFKEKYICRFNDGEQNCDCYLQALSDVEAILMKK